MAEALSKSFDEPDEVVEFPFITSQSVELVGEDVRGVAVHEAARIMASATPGEILVSDLTRALAGGAGARFQDRGTFELKGLDGEWHLSALVVEDAVTA
jgi:class 3 adenylate cyclase